MLRSELRADRRRERRTCSQAGGSGGDQKQIQLQLQGSDANTLTTLADSRSRGWCGSVPGAVDVGLSTKGQKPELKVDDEPRPRRHARRDRRADRAGAAPGVRRRRRRATGWIRRARRATCTCGSRPRRARTPPTSRALPRRGCRAPATRRRRHGTLASPLSARWRRSRRASGRRRSTTISAQRVVTIGANVEARSLGDVTQRRAIGARQGVQPAARATRSSHGGQVEEPERGVRRASSSRSASR